jgi:hypothetical protein
LSEDGLRRLLGFGTHYQLDGFLKAHDIWIEYTLEDFRREVESLDRLGLSQCGSALLSRYQSGLFSVRHYDAAANLDIGLSVIESV